MTFDPNKPVACRDGTRARIICTDAKGSGPIVALVTFEWGEAVVQYGMDGSRYASVDQDKLDLINIPEKRTLRGWVNVYVQRNCGTLSEYFRLHETKEAADTWDKGVVGPRIACIEIVREFTAGEGL